MKSSGMKSGKILFHLIQEWHAPLTSPPSPLYNGNMDSIPKPRDIIDRKALAGALEDLAEWSGHSPKIAQPQKIASGRPMYSKGAMVAASARR